MLTHKYSQSLRGFGPVCACSPTLASAQNTHVTDLCVCICGFYVFEWQPCKVDLDWIAWLFVCGFWCNNTENSFCCCCCFTPARKACVDLCWNLLLGGAAMLEEQYICECVPRTCTSAVTCRDAEERQETQLFGGLGFCACISKHFCSFLHCMHI